MRYSIEKWNYKDQEDKLNHFFDLIKSREFFYVIRDSFTNDGLVIVGDDDYSSEQCKIIEAALNGKK